MNFSEQLKALREKKGLSRAEVARLADIKYTTYNGYEIDNKNPSIANLKKIAKALSVSLDELLFTENIDPLEKIKTIIEEAGFSISNTVSSDNLTKYVKLTLRSNKINEPKESSNKSFILKKDILIKDIMDIYDQVSSECEKQKKDRINAEVFKCIYLSSFDESYEKAEILNDSQYELMQAKKETSCGLSDEEIEKELESYKQELLAEQKGKTLSVSANTKGA